MKNNPFKKIVPTEDLPEEHKERVLNVIDTAKFLLGFADLFTLKQAQINGTILHTILDPTNGDTHQDKSK